MSCLKTLSLFCGLGGMDLGARGGFGFLRQKYAPLPINIVLAVDHDPKTCALYAQNLGPVRCADVGEISDWPDADVILGGPPCQPFSAAGKRQGTDDPRDQVPAFFSVVLQVRPKGFVMENVAGLCGGRHRQAFERLLRQLGDLGYRVDWRVLEAADFGVPQTRKRLFVQGLRKELNRTPAWPKPTHAEQPTGWQRAWVTCREAIADLSPPWHSLPVRSLAEGERRYKGFGAGARRQFADRPMFTITAQDTAAGKMIHPWFDRALTIDELKRGMGFADEFILPKKTPALGNAVPPPLAHAVVKTLAGLIHKTAGKTTV